METSVSLSPEDLGTELSDWVEVDWSSVWDGPPNGGSELDEWLSRYGWKPVELQRQLEVESRHGYEFEFHSGGMWAPVNAVTRSLMRVSSEGSEERGRVLGEMTRWWEEYVAHVVGVAGKPTGVGVAGQPGFPPPPAGEWEVPVSERENPRRLAYWEDFGGGPDAPLLVIRQGVTLATWSEPASPSSNISLSFRRPHTWRRS